MADYASLLCPGLAPDEVELVRGFLYAVDMVRSLTGHGSVHVNITNGLISEIDIEQRIRPQIAAPWRMK